MTKNTTDTSSVDSLHTWPLVAFVVSIGLIILVIASSAFPTVPIVMLAVAVALPTALLALHLHEDRQRHREWTAVLNNMPIPFALASAPGFFKEYARLAEALTKIARHNDLLFRDLALARVEAVADV